MNAVQTLGGARNALRAQGEQFGAEDQQIGQVHSSLQGSLKNILIRFIEYSPGKDQSRNGRWSVSPVVAKNRRRATMIKGLYGCTSLWSGRAELPRNTSQPRVRRSKKFGARFIVRGGKVRPGREAPAIETSWSNSSLRPAFECYRSPEIKAPGHLARNARTPISTHSRTVSGRLRGRCRRDEEAMTNDRYRFRKRMKPRTPSRESCMRWRCDMTRTGPVQIQRSKYRTRVISSRAERRAGDDRRIRIRGMSARPWRIKNEASRGESRVRSRRSNSGIQSPDFAASSGNAHGPHEQKQGAGK